MRKNKAVKLSGIETNNALLNIITPFGGIEFERNKIYLGENVCRIYAIVAYPSTVEMGWLSKISNIPRTISSQIFQPVDNGELIQALSRSVSQNRGIAESTRDTLTRQRAEKAAEDAENLMLQIDQYGETVGYMTNLIMAVAKDDKELNTLCRKVESAVAVQKCKARSLANLQMQGFKTIAPYHTIDEDVAKIARRNIALSTYMGGFPFASSGFTDDTGYHFARDNMGGLVILDPWTRGGDRTNSNWVFTGVSGVGKSAAVKHLALKEFAMGTKIICIDPEREYKDLTQAFGGSWVNSGVGILNPLQYQPTAKDSEYSGNLEDKDEDYGISPLALHFNFLDTFFTLYQPELAGIRISYLRETLEELYNNFGIGWDTDVSTFANNRFPIFADLHKLMQQRHKEATGSIKELTNFLCTVTRELAHGKDSFLWNGHTTVTSDSDFICLDTFDLNESPENIKKADYFLKTGWSWGIMSNNRQEKVLLISDETHMMIDPQVPQSLSFLRKVEKRARKYNAGIAVVSHSVVDFLDPSVKMYGQALLDLPCYKVLMGTDGQNLIETSNLYNLTEVEQDILSSKKRGQAIFMLGSKRMLIDFDISERELAYFGNAAGN